jgi:hypothetical protein
MSMRLLVVAALALALPAAAFAKGPSQASVQGLGLGSGITLGGGENDGTPVMQLAEAAGFFPSVFGQSPNPMLDRRPDGKLGPRYRVVYAVPGPGGSKSRIRQDLYPYATPSPVTYMKPGQKLFRIPGGTRGGWFEAPARLKETLVAAGLPRTAPSGSPSDDGFLSTGMLSALVAALLLAAATAAVVLRRRARPAPAA